MSIVNNYEQQESHCVLLHPMNPVNSQFNNVYIGTHFFRRQNDFTEMNEGVI